MLSINDAEEDEIDLFKDVIQVTSFKKKTTKFS
jgi:hypothetical protein